MRDMVGYAETELHEGCAQEYSPDGVMFVWVGGGGGGGVIYSDAAGAHCAEHNAQKAVC